MYNCFTLDDTATRTGFSKLGVEQVGALITRGVLIDIAALKGVPMLGGHLRDHAADLAAGAGAQKLTLRRATPSSFTPAGAPCGARTTRAISARAPGIGTAAAEWLATQDPMLVGRRQQRRRDFAEPRSAARSVRAIRSCSSSTAFTCSRISARRARRAPCPRVRADRRAAQDSGRHGIDGRAGRDSLGARRSRGPCQPRRRCTARARRSSTATDASQPMQPSVMLCP